MEKNNANARKQTARKCTVCKIIILVLTVIIILLLLLRGCGGKRNDTPVVPTPTPPGPGIFYDPNAIRGGWAEADTGGIIAALNEKVEAGMIRISMNTTPYFYDGASEGNLMIVNEEVNNYPQVVEITRSDTGELIYRSGAIPVGSKVETAKLNIPLSAGTYKCTALFYSVDPDNGAYLGCAGAVITVTILN